MSETPDRTTLYRLYDAAHDLLYIGISRDPETRFKAHAHDKPWWHLVEYVDFTWFDSFLAARRAENAAHLSERPPYNGMGHTGLGWEIPALRYDSDAEREVIRARLTAELKAGMHAPGARLWPFHIGRRYGYSRSVTASAMDELAMGRLLTSRGRTFVVPERWAYAVRRRERTLGASMSTLEPAGNYKPHTSIEAP